MAYPPTNPALPTVLQRIITEMQSRIRGMVDEDGAVVWNNPDKEGPVQGINALAFPLCTLMQGPETTHSALWPFVDKVIRLFIEFRFQRRFDVDSFDTYRYYLGKLQQRLVGSQDNITMGGLTINVTEVGANPEIESQADTSPGGMLMIDVHYRHYINDPYHMEGEAPNGTYGNP